MTATRGALSAEAPLPIDIEWALVQERAREMGNRLVALMRSMTDPSRTAVGYWTVGDLSGHLTQVFGNFSLMSRGGTSPLTDQLKLAEEHDEYLRRHPERNPHALADEVEKSLDEVLENAGAGTPEDLITWHGGIRLPFAVLLALIVEEALIHGWDLAQAEQRNWEIPPVDATLTMKALLAVAPHFLTDEGKRAEASFAIRARGNGTITLRFSNGELRVNSFDQGPIDCRISAAPAEFVLVGAGRIGMWGPIAKGKVMAYGKKPWLGLKIMKYFRNP